MTSDRPSPLTHYPRGLEAVNHGENILPNEAPKPHIGMWTIIDPSQGVVHTLAEELRMYGNHRSRFHAIIDSARPGDHFYYTVRGLGEDGQNPLMASNGKTGASFPARYLGIYRGPAGGLDIAIDDIHLLHLWDYASSEETMLPEMRGLKLTGVTKTGDGIFHIRVEDLLDTALGAEGLAAVLVPELEREKEQAVAAVRPRYDSIIDAILHKRFGPNPRPEVFDVFL